MSSSSPTATQVGATLVDELVRQGVADVVMSPGSRSAPLALAVAAREELRAHVRIDERTAGFLALGLGRASRRPAAVICSSGTATVNLHPAVCEADAAGVPMLVLTADRPPELHDVGANQTMRQQDLYGAAVRWQRTIDADGPDPGAVIRGTVARAIAASLGHATDRVPGPVHLDVPLREPLVDPHAAHTAGSAGLVLPGHGPWTSPPANMPAAAPQVLRADGSLLPWVGRRGMIIAGDGAMDRFSAPTHAAREVLDLAAALGWPVMAEPTSGLRRTSTVLRCGHWLTAAQDWVSRSLPDLIVLLGRPVLSRPVDSMVRAALAAGADVVAFDPRGRWNDHQRLAATQVLGGFVDTVRPGVWGDGEEPLTTLRVPGWLEHWQVADHRAAEVLDRVLDGAEGPSELRTARDTVAAIPEGGALVVSSSLAIRHLNETMVPRGALEVMGNRGLSGIDGFVSSALGVALAHDGPTAALAGDLSIIHDMTGLVIGTDEPLVRLPIVVVNNDGGGIFDLLPYGSDVDPSTFERIFATPHGLPLEGLAMTVGCGYTSVDEPGELAHVIHDAWASPGITLIEVPTDTPAETARYHQVREAITAELG